MLIEDQQLDSGGGSFDGYSAWYRAHRTPQPKLTPCVGHEIEDLARLGDLMVTSQGEENLYFTVTATGEAGFCKLDAALALAVGEST